MISCRAFCGQINYMVKPEHGLHILNQALERIDKTKVEQIKLEL